MRRNRHPAGAALLALLLALTAALPGSRALAQTAEPTPQATQPPQATVPQGQPTVGATGTAGPTPLPQPTRTSNALEGTIAAVSPTDRTVTLNPPRAGGPLRTIQLPANVSVVRNGQPSALEAVEATDRVIVQRDPRGAILSLLVFAVPPTPAPSPTAGPAATVTAGPEATAAPAPTGTPGPVAYTGAVTEAEDGSVTIQGDDGTTRNIAAADAPDLAVTRDGAGARLSDVRVGDQVAVTYGPGDVAESLAATSTEDSAAAGASLRWLFYLLPMLALLLVPLLLILTGRRPGRFSAAGRRGAS